VQPSHLLIALTTLDLVYNTSLDCRYRR